MAAQRIMYDVHKIYKLSLEDQSIPFFEWLKLVGGFGCVPVFCGWGWGEGSCVQATHWGSITGWKQTGLRGITGCDGHPS